MADDNEKIKNRYNRVSKVYDLLEKPMESMTSNKWRDKLIAAIEGKKVLEVGVGTGKNLAYYPSQLDITAIDFSKNMLEKQRLKLRIIKT